MQYALRLVMDKSEMEFCITTHHERKLCEDGISSNYCLHASDGSKVKIHIVGSDYQSFDSYESVLINALYNSEKYGERLTLECDNKSLQGKVIVYTREGRWEIGGWINII